ncbi:class I SAM-dependent methyltransferase [Enterovibrio nigricans]|uniref:SAM-dependent methyltransferase n=1 Tax=Enterovibrio nigricans DSM 22720 TaxID=1121868 RepID=A0A1T4VBF9_9GAMM|nr:methyltransferase domain-containing protein [Enterovibrio nigricans]PKF49989.1 class I SAM-dependent methyltransferase [Enterovibrio nigricans]SKA62302.1 SAM-dependent methyltransferase [Enterovibrio nigricans DSM 22720]
MRDPQTKLIAQSYDNYYEIGLYKSRYPCANPRILSLILSLVKNDTYPILDFGCGRGRYLEPLLQQTDANVLGFDISKVALKQASSLLPLYPERLTLFNKHDDLHHHIVEKGAPSLTLLLFGVIAHVKGKQQRVALLQWLNRNMQKNGTIVVSVPNRHRRFFRHQFNKNSSTSDIQYERNYLGKSIPLFYHLFSVEELKMHLTSSGFEVDRVIAESMLPESWVNRSPRLAKLDQLLCNLLPASLGYGLLAIARRIE